MTLAWRDSQQLGMDSVTLEYLVKKTKRGVFVKHCL